MESTGYQSEIYGFVCDIITSHKMYSPSRLTFEDLFKQCLMVCNKYANSNAYSGSNTCNGDSGVFKNLHVKESFLLDGRVLPSMCGAAAGSALHVADSAVRTYLCRFKTADPPTFSNCVKYYIKWAEMHHFAESTLTMKTPPTDFLTLEVPPSDIPPSDIPAFEMAPSCGDDINDFVNSRFSIKLKLAGGKWEAHKMFHFPSLLYWALFLAIRHL